MNRRRQGSIPGVFFCYVANEAAEEARSPLIIQSTVGTVKHLGTDYIAAADRSPVPIALHLDHCSGFGLIMQCIGAGYTSIMIDASHGPFEENVAGTRKAVEVAEAIGINVEAEHVRVGASKTTSR